MTHETTIKVNGHKFRFSFCTQAFYNLSQKYGCDMAGVFEHAGKDWVMYFCDIVWEAANVCPENDMKKLPDKAITWIDQIDPKDAKLLSDAHQNSKILGKPIQG